VQTVEHNHVAALEALLARGVPDWRGEVQVCFALQKEYEDLGQHAQAFERLARGARLRRRHLDYDVARDLSTVDWIIEAFPGEAPPVRGATPNGPVFVVGLPRSGSTLVERILSSHSALTAAGELDVFATALVAAVRAANGGVVPERRELVAHAAQLDAAALGQDYLRRVAALGVEGRFIDKMPLNYLYVGLIARALPEAVIVHVERQPMAIGYALYKALFRDGYPFSYDLGEIAAYYAGYRRLMDHWTSTLPGRVRVVSYEQLVAEPAAESRRLLAACGLEWEEDCLRFHENPAPTTTASAAQVRRPLYTSAVEQWRHYEAQLEPLRQALEAAGVDVGRSSGSG
jgi:hypothetical protein